MEFNLTTLIALISIAFCIATFVLNRKDKSNQNTEKDSYKWGSIDEKLANIEKTLSKIEDKLDAYDKEVDEKIDMAMEHHVKEYHRN